MPVTDDEWYQSAAQRPRSVRVVPGYGGAIDGVLCREFAEVHRDRRLQKAVLAGFQADRTGLRGP